jgi:hypothetical protein
LFQTQINMYKKWCNIKVSNKFIHKQTNLRDIHKKKVVDEVSNLGCKDHYLYVSYARCW